jgi:hypothetical protein
MNLRSIGHLEMSNLAAFAAKPIRAPPPPL